MNTVRYLRAVAGSGLPRGERDLLRALLTWLNYQSWDFYASVGTIAEAMGVARSSVQRWMASLEGRGIVITIGVQAAGQYRRRVDTAALLALAGHDAPGKGEPHSEAGVPDDEAGDAAAAGGVGLTTGRWVPHHEAQTDQRTDQRTHHTTAAAAVASLLGSEDLLSHPNVTPELLAWIAREAPKKKNPAGWAAGAIREGYKPPPLTPEERRAESRQARDDLLAQYDAMPPNERADILALALADHPRLDPRRPEHQAPIRGAIAKFMAQIHAEGGGALLPDQPY